MVKTLPLSVKDYLKYKDNTLANELGKEIVYYQLRKEQISDERLQLVKDGLTALQNGLDFDFTVKEYHPVYSFDSEWIACYVIALIIDAAQEVTVSTRKKVKFRYYDDEMPTHYVLWELFKESPGGDYRFRDNACIWHLVDYGVEIAYTQSNKSVGEHEVIISKRNVEVSLAEAFRDDDYRMINFLTYAYELNWDVLNSIHWQYQFLDTGRMELIWNSMHDPMRAFRRDNHVETFVRQMNYYGHPLEWCTYTEESFRQMMESPVSKHRQAYFATLMHGRCYNYVKSKMGKYVPLAQAVDVIGEDMANLFLDVFVITTEVSYDNRNDHTEELMELGRKLLELF